ncbi:MAG: SRPBCC family protein, partial [Actinomycetota bacterium]
LSDATTIIDLVADQAEDGMAIVDGSHLYTMRANWKLLVENSFDQYHAMTTHQRYVEMLKASGREFSAASKGPAATGVERMPPLDLGNGHAVSWSVDASGGTVLGGLGRTFPDDDARAKHQARRSRLVELYGEEWCNRMLGGRNHLIFPNLFIIDLVMGCTIRTFYPSAPDYMEVSAWQLVPRGEDEQLRAMRMANFLTFWGPAGLATPDDVEALERCQQGFRAHAAAPWNDLSRGINGHLENNEGQMRVFWRQWNKLVTGEDLPPEEQFAFDPARHGRNIVGLVADRERVGS